MDTGFTIDVNEVILLETDIPPTVEELFASVCEHPYQIHNTLEQLLPRIEWYAEDNFGCNIELNTLYTIEGHTSLEIKIKHFSRNEDASLALSVLKKDDLVPLMKHMVKTLAALLPLPYSVCSHCKTKHKCLKCPWLLNDLQAAVEERHRVSVRKPRIWKFFVNFWLFKIF